MTISGKFCSFIRPSRPSLLQNSCLFLLSLARPIPILPFVRCPLLPFSDTFQPSPSFFPRFCGRKTSSQQKDELLNERCSRPPEGLEHSCFFPSLFPSLSPIRHSPFIHSSDFPIGASHFLAPISFGSSSEPGSRSPPGDIRGSEPISDEIVKHSVRLIFSTEILFSPMSFAVDSLVRLLVVSRLTPSRSYFSFLDRRCILSLLPVSLLRNVARLRGLYSVARSLVRSAAAP